jgi:hypothetical protein
MSTWRRLGYTREEGGVMGTLRSNFRYVSFVLETNTLAVRTAFPRRSWSTISLRVVDQALKIMIPLPLFRGMYAKTRVLLWLKPEVLPTAIAATPLP